jgi:hypothetical protein
MPATLPRLTIIYELVNEGKETSTYPLVALLKVLYHDLGEVNEAKDWDRH